MQLDDTDRLILNRIQSRFPITSRPYRAIAEEIGLTEAELLEATPDIADPIGTRLVRRSAETCENAELKERHVLSPLPTSARVFSVRDEDQD